MTIILDILSIVATTYLAIIFMMVTFMLSMLVIMMKGEKNEEKNA